MITNDATLLKVKHEVLYEVAKLAYEGRLDDERDNLPYKMVPGPQPFFRCCIYREREVVAITLALITKEVYSSLFIGIVIGSVFASGFSFTGSISNVLQDGLIAQLSDSYNVGC